MSEGISSIVGAFLAAIGACFTRYPIGSLVGMVVAMLLTMVNAKLLKTAD